MKNLFFLLVFGLTACSTDAEMQAVEYDYLLNDGNSKVWLIDQMIVNKTDISAQLDHEKELLIFFGTDRFQYVPIKQLGHQNGKTGSYILSSSEKELKLYFKEAIWKFELKEISEDSIYLVPMKGSDAKFSILLVPLRPILVD